MNSTSVPKWVYITGEDVEHFGFTAERPGCVLDAQRNRETSTH